MAGKDPTSATVIKDLRNVTSYNADWLLPESIDFSTVFGHNLPRSCGWYAKAEKKGFVATIQKAYCAPYVVGSSTRVLGCRSTQREISLELGDGKAG